MVGKQGSKPNKRRSPCESFKLQTLISGYAGHHGNNTPGIVVNNMPAVKFTNLRRFFHIVDSLAIEVVLYYFLKAFSPK
jgi:hypothetical protein